MRHILIDTDTASDDAVALLMALREPDVRVEAITTVAGNCPLEQCVKNALICVEKREPMPSGIRRHGETAVPHALSLAPHSRRRRHGRHGLARTAADRRPHACRGRHHRLRRTTPGELEIVTLGPLTNLAMAVLKAPALAEQVKRVYVMGGSGLTPGNITPLAEFNFYADAEAAHLVLNAGLPLTLVGWEIGMGKRLLTRTILNDCIISANWGALPCAAIAR